MLFVNDLEVVDVEVESESRFKAGDKSSVLRVVFVVLAYPNAYHLPTPPLSLLFTYLTSYFLFSNLFYLHLFLFILKSIFTKFFLTYINAKSFYI